MPGVVADTHAFIWYVTNRRRLSHAARQALDDASVVGFPVVVSAISLVEITYLIEKGRLFAAVATRLLEEIGKPDMAAAIAPVDRAVTEAVARIPRDQVSDMPDRIIAATALHLGLPLVTRDGRIRAAAIETIW